MKILVSGGAGFIGSHLAEALVEAGHEVLIIDDLSTGHRENVPGGAKFVQASITSAESDDAIEAFGPSAVFHYAAQIDVRKSVTNPLFDAQTNIAGTIRLAAAAVRVGVQHFVFASTGGAIYGEQIRYPADEEHPKRPESPYGLSKYCAELYLDYFSRTHDLRTVFLRFGNVYGPRQDPQGEAGVVAIFCQKMLTGGQPTINGDGKQTRDYVFVGDVVRANLAALENDQTQGALNIATGIETDVNELGEEIARHAKYVGGLSHGPQKPGEQRRSVLDPSRAKVRLGWQAQIGVSEGLKRTVEWFARQV